MSLETSRLRITGVTGGPLRITGASLVNGAYELATAGGADYELQTERQTIMDNILFIPGIANPVSEINQLLFGQGQQGTFIAPSLTASLISGSTFGTGIETLPDLSPRNNPFSQANSGNRAAWFREPKTGRRNLFVSSQQFEDLVWSKAVGGASVSANIATAPNGTLTAAKLVSAANTNEKSITQQSPLTGSAETISCHMKKGEWEFGFLRARTSAGFVNVFFNLNTGVVVSTGTGMSNATIQSVGDGWFRCSVTLTRVTSEFVAVGMSSDGVSITALGDGTSGIFIWGAQLELGSAPTPYQRVTTAFDVTESGQRDCFGVRADGIDDGYATAGNVDFSGTNKVTVFAAVRKLSDAASGDIVMLGSGATADGQFRLLGPSGAGSNNYRFRSRGTTPQDSTAPDLASPNTSVITCIGDISGPLSRIRVNGVVAESVTASQGTGNYRSDSLLLFRLLTSPFNGNLYALIVAGGSYPLSTIQRVERILSRITPTVNL
jgi:hypothetical protein